MENLYTGIQFYTKCCISLSWAFRIFVYRGLTAVINIPLDRTGANMKIPTGKSTYIFQYIRHIFSWNIPLIICQGITRVPSKFLAYLIVQLQ
jgi:hypothetical protein